MPKGKAYAGSSVVFGNPVLEYAPKWLDIEKIKAISTLPVLLKGISHPDDARQAIKSGVAHTLHILRTELEMAMVLSGCNTLSDIDHSILFT